MSEFPLNDLTVCKKMDDGRVVYQSEPSIRLCDHRVGDSCPGCRFAHSSDNGDRVERHRVHEKNAVYSRVQIRADSSVTTILVPETEWSIDIDSLVQTAHLSKRELEIVELIRQSRSNGEIILQLVISESTLKSHLNNIYRKVPQLKEFREFLQK